MNYSSQIVPAHTEDENVKALQPGLFMIECSLIRNSDVLIATSPNSP